MKITIIAPTEIPSRRANSVQVMKMAQAFQESGNQVKLISPAAPGESSEHLQSVRSWQHLAIHYGLQQPFPIIWLPARPRLKRYDFCWQAVNQTKREKSELLFTRLPQAAALSSTMGLPTIMEIHDFPQGVMGPLLFRLFLKGSGARRLVVITRALAIDLNQKFSIPGDPTFTMIAPDGVDLERYQNFPDPIEARQSLIAKFPELFPALDKEGQRFPDRFTIGYTGHLYPGRGTQLILELAAQLPYATFLIVGGEAGDIASLREAVARKQLTNVIITGFVPNLELPTFQAACDALLMPYQDKVSASSGGDIARYLSPMKLFEYMASQRVILSSDLPVLQETLNDRNSILLPVNKTQAWLDALLQIISDPGLAQKLASQARLDVEKYTWQARAGKILEAMDLKNVPK